MNTFSILSGVKVGRPFPVRIMGVINASPESFYASSIASSEKKTATLALQMEQAGADFIDVGAMSSAPYLKTEIPEREEAARLKKAIRAIRKACSLPISIDTYRWGPAEEGLGEGATIINDITGFVATPSLVRLAKEAKGVILMAHPRAAQMKPGSRPVWETKNLLQKCLKSALNGGISKHRIVLDPGIGFFRHAKIAWWKWDLSILNNLDRLTDLPVPLMVGVSRKSFIGHILGGLPPMERLAGSLAATAIAVLNGAALIRTHDVKPTREAVRIAESMRNIKAF